MSVALLTSSSKVVTPDYSECRNAKNTCALQNGMQPYNIYYIYIYYLKDKGSSTSKHFVQTNY